MFIAALVSMRKLMFVSQIMRVSTVGVSVTLLLTAKTNCTSSTSSEESLSVPCITCLTTLLFVDSQTRAKRPVFWHDLHRFPLTASVAEWYFSVCDCFVTVCGDYIFCWLKVNMGLNLDIYRLNTESWLLTVFNTLFYWIFSLKSGCRFWLLVQ